MVAEHLAELGVVSRSKPHFCRLLAYGLVGGTVRNRPYRDFSWLLLGTPARRRTRSRPMLQLDGNTGDGTGACIYEVPREMWGEI